MRRWSLLLLLSCLLLAGCEKKEEYAQTESPVSGEKTQSESVMIDDTEYEPDLTTELELGANCSLEVFLAALPELPALESVRWRPCPLSNTEKRELKERRNDISFDWDLRLGNSVISSLDKEADFSTEAKDITSLLELLPLMDAGTVTLEGWNISNEEAALLREAGPGKIFLYTVELFGIPFSTGETEIDISEVELEDTEELEEALVHFDRLEKVLMLHCGLDNETMDELNTRHEGMRFVWLVQVMTLAIRSDRTYFTIYNPDELRYTRESPLNLRYCHDLVAVDLGHCGIGQDDLEFVRGCPKLEFLIIAECYMHNLEPLRDCPNLRYLEAFKTYLNDISALEDCPKLTDLNLCYIPSLGPDCVDTLKNMTQLEHLWFCDANFSATRITELRDALPNTEFLYYRGPESTGAGWRDHDIYFEMRDALHMHYMN